MFIKLGDYGPVSPYGAHLLLHVTYSRIGVLRVFSMPAVPIIIVLCAALVAAVTDVWKFKVYNALTLPLLALRTPLSWIPSRADSIVWWGSCSGSPR